MFLCDTNTKVVVLFWRVCSFLVREYHRWCPLITQSASSCSVRFLGGLVAGSFWQHKCFSFDLYPFLCFWLTLLLLLLLLLLVFPLYDGQIWEENTWFSESNIVNNLETGFNVVTTTIVDFLQMGVFGHRFVWVCVCVCNVVWFG